MCIKTKRRVQRETADPGAPNDDGKAGSSDLYAVLCSVYKKTQKYAPNITYSYP